MTGARNLEIQEGENVDGLGLILTKQFSMNLLLQSEIRKWIKTKKIHFDSIPS